MNNCRMIFFGSRARQSDVFDARYHGQARIEYPLHPLFGRGGRVVRQVKYPQRTCLEIMIDHKIVNVARWMTRADLCQQLICGHDPVPDVKVLLRVLRLLDDQHD